MWFVFGAQCFKWFENVCGLTGRKRMGYKALFSDKHGFVAYLAHSWAVQDIHRH